MLTPMLSTTSLTIHINPFIQLNPGCSDNGSVYLLYSTISMAENWLKFVSRGLSTSWPRFWLLDFVCLIVQMMLFKTDQNSGTAILWPHGLFSEARCQWAQHVIILWCRGRKNHLIQAASFITVSHPLCQENLWNWSLKQQRCPCSTVRRAYLHVYLHPCQTSL